MIKPCIALFVSFVLFVGALPTPANETDQFNLPPVLLADIAPEIEAYVAQNIQTAIDKLNTEIARHEACTGEAASLPSLGEAASLLPRASSPRVSSPHVSKGQTSDGQEQPRPKTCSTDKTERAKLDSLRSSDALAQAVHDQLGAGNIFISNTGKWLNTHKFEHEPARYVAPYKESIYFTAPVDYATISPTVRVYGVEFGTDKFDHLFQQGYTYYRKYNAARHAGKTDAEALKAAVDYGRFTENTFFGYTVSGVYSNADLAANLAGLKFYQNLSNDVQIADKTIPTILKLIDGRWQFSMHSTGTQAPSPATPQPSPGQFQNEAVPSTMVTPLIVMSPPVLLVPFESEMRAPVSLTPRTKRTAKSPTTSSSTHQTLKTLDSRLLEPFITDHLNEALNPSNYLFFLYPVVKSVIKKRACPEWHAAFPTLTRESLTNRTAALTTWNGLDYGYKTTSRQPHLSDLCFPDPKGPAAKEEE